MLNLRRGVGASEGGPLRYSPQPPESVTIAAYWGLVGRVWILSYDRTCGGECLDRLCGREGDNAALGTAEKYSLSEIVQQPFSVPTVIPRSRVLALGGFALCKRLPAGRFLFLPFRKWLPPNPRTVVFSFGTPLQTFLPPTISGQAI